jgi:outer membrane lipoprotein SlyB
MRTSWRRLVAVIAVAALLQACAVPGGTVYAPGETGRVMRVEPAEVVSAREVTVSGLDDRQAAGWGTLVGATIAGSAAYGITGADNPAGVAVTIIATVVGGLAGLALVQSLRAGETIYAPGTEVSLIHGARGFVRVVPAQA